MLTDHEIEVLFALMEKLKAQGVTILYISHKLKEVKRICDRVMVLRDGDMISINRTDDVNEHEMACSMVGRELSQVFPEKTTPQQDVVFACPGSECKRTVRSN